MKQITKLYPCKMESLYLVSRLMWSFCLKNMTAFAAFDTNYTPQLVNNAMAALKEAEAIKDLDQRNGDGTTQREKLTAAATACYKNWQSLKRYIDKAYPKSPGMLAAAGQRLYLKAAQLDWTATSKLLKAGTVFLLANEQELINKGMPATFRTTYNDAATLCLGLLEGYDDTQINNYETSSEKVMANNAVYSTLISMLGDAQQVFKAQETARIRTLFTFSRALRVVEGNRSARIRGGVTNSDTGKALKGAVITVSNETYNATTGTRGRYDMARVAAGTYTVLVTCPGFLPVKIEVTIKASTTFTLDVAMVPEPLQEKVA